MKPSYWHIGQAVHTTHQQSGAIIALSKLTHLNGLPQNVLIANHNRKYWVATSTLRGWHGKTNMSVEALQKKYITSKHEVITSMDEYLKYIAQKITKK